MKKIIYSFLASLFLVATVQAQCPTKITAPGGDGNSYNLFLKNLSECANFEVGTLKTINGTPYGISACDDDSGDPIASLTISGGSIPVALSSAPIIIGTFPGSPCSYTSDGDLCTPTPFSVTGGGSFCAEGTGVAIGLSGSQTGVSYQLKIGAENVGQAVLGNIDGSAITFGSKTATGNYTVVATRSGCTAVTMTGNATVTENPLPTLTGPNTVAVGSTITLVGTDAGTPPVTEPMVILSVYASSNTDIATVTNVGVVTGVSSGIVTITYTDSKTGCKASKVITVSPPCASLRITAPVAGSIYLQGGSTTVSVTASGGTPPYQYKLNNGAYQSSSSFYITAGSYNVTVKDVNACTTTSSAVYVADGTPPITCPSTIRIEFNQLTANGSALPDVTGVLRTFIQADNVTYSDQLFNINCGTITGGNLGFNQALLADAIQVLTRTFVAKNTGSIISYSCSQQIYIGAPKLADVAFPIDKILLCADSRIEPTDTSINHVTVFGTGFPTIFNQVVGEGLVKNLTKSYTDERINNANGFTIKRTWVAKDICNNETRTVIQNLTYRSDAGTCPTALSSISGKIRREDLMDIPAKISVFNTANELLNNTTNPTYSFNNLLVNKGYRVTVERPNTDWTNGVTTFDVALISRHVLGITPLATPYQLIAADANRNGEVDAADLLHFQRLILRLDNQLPNNNSWRFVPKNYVFLDPTNPFASDFPEMLNVLNLTNAVTNGDFVAIKIGDVNQSAGSINISSSAKPFLLNTEEMILEKGKNYQIPIQMTLRGKNVGEVSNLADISAVQFTLNVDKSAAKIESIQTGDLPNFTDNNIGLFQKEGLVTAAWYRKDGQLLSETDKFTMLTVSLTPTKNTRLSEIMTLNSAALTKDETTEGVAYDANGMGLPIQLNFDIQKASSEKTVLLPNRPNPFRNETTIAFILPETSTAKLTVYDLLGKVVMVSEKQFAKGLNEVVFDVTMAPVTSARAMTSGIFVVRLQTATGVAEQKIVLQR